MQRYKKQIVPHLWLGGVLAIVFYFLANCFLAIPVNSFGEKEFAFFTYSVQAQAPLRHWWFLLGPSLWSLLAAFLGFLLAMLLYIYRNDHGLYRVGEEHGSARFATTKEMTKYADQDFAKNTLLSQNGQMGLFNARLPMPVQRNKNMVVIGGAGSGKTFTFVKPNLMQMNASMVITDPKGLLVHEVGHMLREAGYQIKVFDLANLSNSNTFNVFAYMPTELDVDRVLESISISIAGNEQKPDFWKLASDMLLRSLIAFLWFDGRDNGYLPHIGQVADLLRNIIRVDPEEPSQVENWMNELEQKHPGNYAVKQWRSFETTGGAAETKAGIVGNAVAVFASFDHQAVRQMIEYDTMDIGSWNEKKTAVFISIPELSSSYNFLASMLVATSITTLSKKADQVNQGLLQVQQPLQHVRYYLDEFANIGKLPNIDKAMATLRSREMSIVIILQALDQLKTMYNKGWASLLATADTLLFLGGNEKETTEYLSQRSGKQTISIRNHSLNSKGGGSENRQTQARDLLTPDEIGRLDGQKALVFINGENVLMDQKYSTFDHPNANKLANKPTDDHWYEVVRYTTPFAEMWRAGQEEGIPFIDHGTL
ncbi:VirD4-like conjugal transfer protein, CD1115 family [Fructobacillus evanidus]|uniref:TraG/TraD family ATPase (VirD4) n=1 Tax=Fructobacillus evanidus TaxID=3064281 RepID=A0ABM9MWX7_9LACO|nr:TraG/TraD family ATPase (VirD4) [Fructobacillus sp. LMG 32999]CAK1230959.1 TraG/TraD family ATPase (VirD4) [Fructobacillus sp. LMG 32999]CAK1231047.1 TraG/TraD family ATPase (VirD4) [Fructobacillus sp. LMG 32999]CAK1232161.1 TraG/TraD family ATPase (VirD4) [Fructobacillus sp. LMG 32999]CAK1240745.1 TraG/TraD family ATPase (VirD4) [Fructobacillus sp. LMG 32999]